MPDQNRLVYYTSPLPLRVISALKMALVLWRHKFTDLCSSDTLPSVWFCTKDIIAVQTMVEKQVDPYIPALGKELKQWMDYHSEKIFFDSDLGWAVLRCFNNIVCYASGAINYVATARKLVGCELLNDTEKYRLACVYCLEDDVRSLFSSVYCGRSKGLHNSTIKPVVHYWNNIQNREVHCKHVCYKRIIAMYTKCARNWTGFLHFIEDIPVSDQTAYLMELIENDPMAALYVLPKMTVEQQRLVAIKHGGMIWKHFAVKSRYQTYALRVWCFFSQFANVSQFYDIIRSMVDDKEFGLRVKSTRNQHIGELLFETWNLAPYTLKHYVAHKYGDEILKVLYEVDNDTLRIACRDARFLVAVLATTGVEFQTKLWHDHGKEIIFNVPPKYLDELVGICVKNTDEITRLKSTLSEDTDCLKKYCRFSFKEGYFEDVNDFLNFCRVDQGYVIDLKKNLLSSIRSNACSVLLLDDLEKWCKLDQFIDECYDPEAATEFRTDMVSSLVMHKVYNRFLFQGGLFEVRRFIDVFLSPDQSSRLKQDLAEECKSNLIAGNGYNLNEANWKEFLNWSFNNDKAKIEEFKASLPIDEIVDNMLRKCVESAKDGFFLSRKKTHTCDLVKLDNFFAWYFATKQAIREFKSNKIEAYGNIDDIKSTFDVDSTGLACILNWFYEGDREKIHRRKHSAAGLSPPGIKQDTKRIAFFKS